MSMLAIRAIEEAGLMVGDPGLSRVTTPEWTVFLNRTARTMARRMRLVEREAYFDTAVDDLYAMPADCIQIKWLRYNPTPSTPETEYKLDEMVQDDWDDVSQRTLASGEPRKYLPRQGMFHLYPKPATAIVNAGHICYWGMPDAITNPNTQSIPFADFLFDTLVEGMVVNGLKKLEKFEAAAARKIEWEESLVYDRDKMEDRSEDRRPNMMTGSRRRGYDGQA